MAEETKKTGALRRIVRAVGIVLLAVVMLAAGLIGFLSVTEFRPADVETLAVGAAASRTLCVDEPFAVLTWNIGYGALGDNADFFMDGGSMVRTADKARVTENLENIGAQIDALRPDVVFLQETDVRSTRSCRVNEYAWMQSHLQGYASSFAANFKVAFLPYPVPPIGRVESGLATFSAFDVSSAERVQLPIPFSWPIRMANLKRCLLCSRVPIAGSEHELVLVNLHLEAYDDGEGKAAQTAMLAQLLAAEAEKGNYVIAGGDFNQYFSDMDADAFPTLPGNWEAGAIDVTQFEGSWQFLMDDSVPTCRSLYKPYADADRNSFQYYMIDGFIVSNNVAVSLYATQDCGFTATDHNPVLMRCTLAGEES